jgi:hypothetical protein
MKTSWMIVLALGVALPVSAQNLQGFRGNDPFTFCRYGYDINTADVCWLPTAPYTGSYQETRHCLTNKPRHWNGRRLWDARDYLALSLYKQVCSQATGTGNTPKEWLGPGNGSDYGVQH